MLFFTEVYCPLARAFSLLQLDQPRKAAAEFERVTRQWVGAGLMIWVPSIKASHAEALMAMGDWQDALQLLDEALAQIDQMGWGERSSMSEILRLKGCGLYRCGDTAGAETLFRWSMQVARTQGARSFELRTANSFASLLMEQSRRAEATVLLHQVYDGFVDVGDQRDLREASELIRQLD